MKCRKRRQSWSVTGFYTCLTPLLGNMVPVLYSWYDFIENWSGDVAMQIDAKPNPQSIRRSRGMNSNMIDLRNYRDFDISVFKRVSSCMILLVK